MCVYDSTIVLQDADRDGTLETLQGSLSYSECSLLETRGPLDTVQMFPALSVLDTDEAPLYC